MCDAHTSKNSELKIYMEAFLCVPCASAREEQLWGDLVDIVPFVGRTSRRPRSSAVCVACKAELERILRSKHRLSSTLFLRFAG